MSWLTNLKKKAANAFNNFKNSKLVKAVTTKVNQVSKTIRKKLVNSKIKWVSSAAKKVYSVTDKIKAKAKQAVTAVKEKGLFKAIGDGIKNGVKKVKEKLTGWALKIRDAIKGVIDWLSTIPPFSWIAKAFEWLKNFFTKLGTWIKKVWLKVKRGGQVIAANWKQWLITGIVASIFIILVVWPMIKKHTYFADFMS